VHADLCCCLYAAAHTPSQPSLKSMEAYKQLVQSKTVRAKHVDEPPKGTDDAGSLFCLAVLLASFSLEHIRCMS
jgi:hypothetical protein